MSIIKHGGKEYKIRSSEVVWNATKDKQLRVFRSTEKSVETMAKYFGCSESVIFRRMKVLGLTDNPWTLGEDKLLADNYTKLSDSALAKLVHSNSLYVHDRLDYLGLERAGSVD